MKKEGPFSMSQALELLHGELFRELEGYMFAQNLCMKYNTWNKAYFPRLDAPFSPCCSLQWTMRDDQVYNIPVLLLVKGDIILLRPGHKAPAQCSLQHDGLGEDAEDLLLEENEIFAPDSGKHGEVFTQPKGRQPRKPARFLLLDTPATTLVRQILSDCKRPASTIEHEKFLIMTHWIERRIIPVVCVVMLVVNILRYIYLGGHVGHWTDMIILLQVQAIVPLVPLIVPLMYLLINFYGQARVFAAFEAEKGTKSLGDDSFDSDSSISADEARVDLPWPHVLEWFRNILLGRSLCCVDKKGILSYPNPTPEKIFFLHREHAESGTSVTHSESKHATDKPKPAGKFVDHAVKSTCVEVLDGLTILANTCNLNTAQWYSQFTDHVACAGLENEETVAVINRRCLCALAREMGFSTNALNIFYQERTLGVYQQVSAEMTTKERLQRAKSFIQHKIPMPNMVSIILREKLSGACQMLSQGTADILLAHCTDFWDGEDLAPLTTSDRKKILDFYHRTSIGSYCTAFSYCPLRQRLLTGLEDVDEDQDLLCDPVGGRGSWELPRSFSADSLTEAANIGSLEDVPTLVQAHNSQVFIGMVTMQYQARLDFIQLIDKLEGACIRFVHFSQENEVRSRDEMQSQTCSGNPVSRNKDTAAGDTEDSLQASQRKISTSAPSVVHLGSSQVKFEPKVQTAIVSPRRLRREAAEDYHTATTEEILLLNTKQGEYEDEALLSGGEYSWMGEEEELSRHASSYITENTEDSLAFDNRAKLPRGIENIRPHLSSIDNVPLLVNLFTDCSPETTGEMIQIMQEHGEVVLCVGSSANTQNTPLFLRADCSVICPIIINKDGNISLIHLIAEARNQLMCLRNCFYFMLCCSLSVTGGQLVSSVVQLPTLLPPQHLLWLVLIVIPLLGLTMMGNPVDHRVMSLATSKNNSHLSNEMIVRFTVYYVLRFGLPVAVALICYGLTLHSYCQTLAHTHSHTNCAVFDFRDHITKFYPLEGPPVAAMSRHQQTLANYHTSTGCSQISKKSKAELWNKAWNEFSILMEIILYSCGCFLSVLM
ncbi:TMM94-like protein [Mya arenaria]|uniref:TMM94-like protein n=1 Tax=Mya arenaria TaxID=6604 RepID=A0ABY7DIY6_MYAAR|nr:TMM94-like protein [Mya arenaria]